MPAALRCAGQPPRRPFYRASLAFAAQTFLLTERQLHRGVDRGGERLLIEAAQPMFGVDQVVAGVELSVGLHHGLLPQRALCTQLPLV